jgi:tRNA-2-methylthio-N6-dimethylallyladenosine synthase
VLLEKPGRYPGQLIGRSPYLQAVHVAAGKLAIGDIVRVRISQAMAHSLRGEVAQSAAMAGAH